MKAVRAPDLVVEVLRGFHRIAPRTTAKPAPLAGNSTKVSFRSMRPEDAVIEQAFVRGLSKSSRHLRFFSAMPELLPDLLYSFTHPQFPQSFALIATISEADKEQIIGVARYMHGEPGLSTVHRVSRSKRIK